MRLKYIVALTLFFGNIFIIMLGQYRKDILSRKLMRRRDKIIVKINEILMCLTAIALAVIVLFAVREALKGMI